ncbi:MAG: GNAT family N-acetyltransferase, partial [Candidatus Acidiferrales bacterium]
VQKQSVSVAGITVRPCAGLAEFDACVALQQTVWGNDITVPSPIFVVALETGGQVLGAFDSQGRMVGFTLALAGFHDGKPFLHSHMAAVLPELQNQKIGRMLKLAQREEALSRGIQLIEWTFDPLELRNAHFNIVRLGAIMPRFIPNCYGLTESPLHAGLPTDRLVADWQLDSERVGKILEGNAIATNARAVHISVPSDIGQWKSKDRARAIEAQSKVRAEFLHWFGQRYVVTGLERAGAVTNYVLDPPSA